MASQPETKKPSAASRYLFLFLIGLVVGAICTVMAMRALQARQDPFPDSVMQVMAKHSGQLADKVKQNRCAATDTIPHVRTLRAMANDLEMAFPGIADDICVSNTNRQLPALDGQYGRNKAETMAERCRAINPLVEVDVIPQFLTASNMADLLDRGFDLVLDACDSFRVKVEMIAWCRRRKLPIVVSGSAGGRTDPTQIRLRDLSRTEHDALLALVRKKLRAEFNFPKNKDRYFGVQAVYSLENVKYPQADGTVCGLRPQLGADAALKLDCGVGLGAATHITGAFAFAMVGKALELLAKPAKRGITPAEG